MDLENLVELAKKARGNSYCPYSNFAVGAALLCKSGKVYTGCNIENGGIQANCSERTAFMKAISEGEKEFERIVIIGGPKDKDAEKCLPCGYCRQFMSEFVSKDFKIKYRRSVLGVAWSVLNPLFTMLVITTVFGKLLKIEVDNFERCHLILKLLQQLTQLL